MPMNKIPRLREPRGLAVQQVRDLFMSTEFKETPEEFYAEDVKLVEQLDFLVQRCVIMQRKEVEPSVKLLAQMLKWRKERKLREMSYKMFPRELTLAGAAFLYEPDKYGNHTLYLRASLCKNCAELKQTTKDFITYLMYKLDDCVTGNNYAIVMDLTNTTLSNYDIDLLLHLLSLLKDHFPVNMDYFLAVNFPWILTASWHVVKRLIPAERRDAVQFINAKQVFDYIDKHNCPDFLGGTCARPYAFVDEESPNTIDYLQQHTQRPISRKRLRELTALFSDVLPKDHVSELMRQIDSFSAEGIKPRSAADPAEPAANANASVKQVEAAS